MLVDSHCHLDGLNYDTIHTDLADVVNKATERGVSHLLSVSVTLPRFKTMIELIAEFDNIHASCGVHPLNLEDEYEKSELLALAQNEKVVAIGETGLDYFYSPENKDIQQVSFRNHIQVAIELNKPLIIHTRGAVDDTIRILKEEGAEKIGGVIHCFTESDVMAAAVLEMGFYISISGIVTFKSAKDLQAVVKTIPTNRLLVETDSPYLAPVPYRGKENQPAYVRAVAEFVADLRGVTFAELAESTTENYFKLFNAKK
ncbi:TatD family hydrolase [Moritella viscosa]|uniref:Putative deoxyribonuclease n=1 Tax=Moritella viscosa TaxID=80854 RepID=A0A1L0EZF5_9GAMM|nr:YchF/TatD family DNA exonuclease [Moritella viscosa]SGZ13989.1 Putative deoxyribonuclease [Moritella viscosa]SHO13704.1 Putative deoxyribonuclease [Moritella viscosa]SHO13706.1 Putative deoxyribonuclease [Moritella viscosa]SHO17066.1 Putative deoxyribonuclease [Moritella viscosa]SHO18672.1 Putative deoxyribonuclease [Moritella viscosa]